MISMTRLAIAGAALLLLLTPQATWGHPVVGEVLPLRQPDGSVIQTRIWGDEFYTDVESLDGFTLIRDPLSGWICYARLSADGNEYESTGVPAGTGDPVSLGLSPHLRIHAASARAKAAAARADFEKRRHEGPWAPPAPRDGEPRGPTTGNVQGICLLIDFSDDVGTIHPVNVNNYCNQVGYTGYGNNGSVRDYFHDISQGLLTYTNFVPATYYRAAQPKTYYTDPNIPYGTRARELILEALNYLEANGFNFSQYDADGDGLVDALNCFYAGYSNSAWATGLWPHAWTVNFCADGVCTNRYQMTDMQDTLRLGTFCHENGHMLCGWPDLYDYDYDSRGVGRYCLMAYGTTATNPCEPCAYLKYIAGWTTTNLLVIPQNGLSLPVSSGNVIYKFEHPTLVNEYYLIENRQKIARDSGLPDAGLAVWHIDTLGNNNYQQQTPTQHYLVTLVQADGRWDLENNVNYGDNTDLYKSPTYTACTPTTSPNTHWWSGSPSGLYVQNIGPSGTLMTFDFVSGVDCNGNGIPDYLDISGGTSEDCNGNYVPDECDLTRGLATDCNDNGVLDECEPDCNENLVPDSWETAQASGLIGMYFDNSNFTGRRQIRLDATVNFNWGTGSPLPEIGPDTFSIRWSGYLLTTSTSGFYSLFTRTDDGVRLWLDGELLINKWIDQGPTEWATNLWLDGNRAYPLVMEYYENGGGAVAELRWQPPSSTKVIIPTTNLRPALDANLNGIPDECELLGDLNCDGVVDVADIVPFVQALIDPTAYEAQYPNCARSQADTSGNGLVDGGDVRSFVSLLLGA